MGIVLGIESSCDETGVALVDSNTGLLSHALYSQVAMHADYGGVVPELASRDHIRRVLPLLNDCLHQAQCQLTDIDAVAFTAGPGLAGALLVGASVANGLAFALNKPVIPVHHLEGHLLSPLLAQPAPCFPFVALLVSGGHTQLMAVEGVGHYTLLGESVDDAAGEAFDKSAKLLGLGYPGGPALAQRAAQGNSQRFNLPRPMLHSGDFDFSFSGLKTAVLTLVKQHPEPDEQTLNDLAASIQQAIVDVLVHKSVAAMRHTGLPTLVVAGGVGANQQLRTQLNMQAARRGFEVFYPPLTFCTDNGAMIAFAGAQRLAEAQMVGSFSIRPRWPLDELKPVTAQLTR